MINTSVDLVPPIRSLESFIFSKFLLKCRMDDGDFFRGCEHTLFSGLEEEMYHGSFERSCYGF